MLNLNTYVKHNILQLTANIQCLEEYDLNASWRGKCSSIIDIGCGDGSFTSNVLIKLLPNNFKEVVGTDSSEEMIQHANKHYKHDRVSFQVLDIEGKLAEKYKNYFEQAFSFFALHFPRNQVKVFANIYDLLAPGGGCFLVILGRIPSFFNTMRILARTSKWHMYVSKDVISPYHECVDPKAKVQRIMIEAGFTDIEVSVRNTTYNFKDIEDFKACAKAVNPYNIPEDNYEDYFIDFAKIAQENGLDKNFMIEYDLIVARGKKQGQLRNI